MLVTVTLFNNHHVGVFLLWFKHHKAANWGRDTFRNSYLLDQLWAVVDGRPVQQRDVLFVWLPDVISGLHQLLTALQDPKPDQGKTGSAYLHKIKSLKKAAQDEESLLLSEYGEVKVNGRQCTELVKQVLSIRFRLNDFIISLRCKVENFKNFISFNTS